MYGPPSHGSQSMGLMSIHENHWYHTLWVELRYAYCGWDRSFFQC